MKFRFGGEGGGLKKSKCVKFGDRNKNVCVCDFAISRSEAEI